MDTLTATNEPLTPRSDPEPRPRRHRRLLGALAGLTAAATALGVAEAVAALSRSFQSPVLDVGDRVVDAVPRGVKDLAVRWFGTNDKVALLIGIGTILALYAGLVGVVAFGRHLRAALVGIALFGVIGAWASQTTRRAAPWSAIIPSLVGAVAAVGVLVLLRRAANGSTDRSPGDPAGTPERHPTIAELVPDDRRRFLATAGGVLVVAAALGAAGRRGRQRFSVADERRSLSLPPAAQPLEPPTAGITAPVPGVSPFFTPNRAFYRIDTALAVPQVSVDTWALRITGMVGRPVTITYDELLRRRLVEADVTLTCVSNEIGGHLLGTARWLGVRLDDLLAEVAIDPGADQVVGRSVDGFTCGFPLAALDGRDALVAVGMNGEALPLQHGFPARLVVPGLYGYASATKWLTELELTRFDRFDPYWVRRGWSPDAPIKVQSRIDTPRGLANVAAGSVAVAGVAWAPTRGIAAVEVQFDDGPWTATTLADDHSDATWRQWSTRWNATPGRHTIRVRATEKNGPIQTGDRHEPFPSGATGHHEIVVIAR